MEGAGKGRANRSRAEAEATAHCLYFKGLPLTGNKANSYMCLVVDAS